MPAKADITQDTRLESGNVAALLSRLSGVSEREIEERLGKGMLPRALADELGVDEEFCEIVTARVSFQLCDAVKNSVITKSGAQKLAHSFEKGFLNQ